MEATLLSVTTKHRTAEWWETHLHMTSSRDNALNTIGHTVALDKTAIVYNLSTAEAQPLLTQCGIDAQRNPKKFMGLVMDLTEVATSGTLGIPGARTFIAANRFGIELEQLHIIRKAAPIMFDGKEADEILKEMGLPDSVVTHLEPRLVSAGAGFAMMRDLVIAATFGAAPPPSSALVVSGGLCELPPSPCSPAARMAELLVDIHKEVKTMSPLVRSTASGVSHLQNITMAGFAQQQDNYLAQKKETLETDMQRKHAELQKEHEEKLERLEFEGRLGKQMAQHTTTVVDAIESGNARTIANLDGIARSQAETHEMLTKLQNLIASSSASSQVLLNAILGATESLGSNLGALFEIATLLKESNPVSLTLADLQTNPSTATSSSCSDADTLSTTPTVLTEIQGKKDMGTKSKSKGGKAKADPVHVPQSESFEVVMGGVGQLPAAAAMVNKAHLDAVTGMSVEEAVAILLVPVTTDQAQEGLPLRIAIMLTRFQHELNQPGAAKMIELFAAGLANQLTDFRPLVVASALVCLKFSLDLAAREPDAAHAVATMLNKLFPSVIGITGRKTESLVSNKAKLITSTVELASEMLLVFARALPSHLDPKLALSLLKDDAVHEAPKLVALGVLTELYSHIKMRPDHAKAMIKALGQMLSKDMVRNCVRRSSNFKAALAAILSALEQSKQAKKEVNEFKAKVLIFHGLLPK